jgi:hypothetical protein
MHHVSEPVTLYCCDIVVVQYTPQLCSHDPKPRNPPDQLFNRSQLFEAEKRTLLREQLLKISLALMFLKQLLEQVNEPNPRAW